MLIEKLIVVNLGLNLRRRSIVLQLVAMVVIYSLLVPLVLVHVWIWLYQEIYFSIFEIPKVRFLDYMIIDRRKLSRLNWFQRVNCAYCGYANCLVAWVKVVINRTEAYSCAIKHSVFTPGQEHGKSFQEYEKFR